MPALIFLGRRWRLASDDFVYEGLSFTVVGLLWLGIFSVGLSVFPSQCQDALHLRALLIIFLVVTSLSVLANVAVAVTSSLGTVMNPRPRRHISWALGSRLLVLLMECALTLAAVVISFLDMGQCIPSVVVWVIKGSALAFTLTVLAKIFSIIMSLDNKGKLSSHQPVDASGTSCTMDETPSAMWKDSSSWTLMSLCCFGDRSNAESAFADIANVFTSVFHDVDLVASDVLAGLMLLYKRYDTQCWRSRPCVETAEMSWMNIDSAFHFFKFAYASYGVPMVIYRYPCLWPCLLLPHIKCCSCRPAYHRNQSGLESCGCRLGALHLLAGVRKQDVVYVTQRNRIYQVPFYVALDHATQAVVVATRGSISLHDLVTDLNGECDALPDDLGLPSASEADSAHQCHRGILRAALYVRDRLSEGRILEQAFASNPDYDLVFVGHSLGAGVAAVLGLLLRRQYPALKCYLFGPPGGMLTPEVAMLTRTFAMSVVLGCDFFARLSIATVVRLKIEITDALGQCNKPKFKVLAKGFWKMCLANEKRLKIVQEERNPLVRGSSCRSYSSVDMDTSMPLMCMPGKILHLVRSPIAGTEGGFGFEAHWREAKDFDKILVTPRMLTDHFPKNLIEAMEFVCQKNRSATLNHAMTIPS